MCGCQSAQPHSTASNGRWALHLASCAPPLRACRRGTPSQARQDQDRRRTHGVNHPRDHPRRHPLGYSRCSSRSPHSLYRYHSSCPHRLAPAALWGRSERGEGARERAVGEYPARAYALFVAACGGERRPPPRPQRLFLVSYVPRSVAGSRPTKTSAAATGCRAAYRAAAISSSPMRSRLAAWVGRHRGRLGGQVPAARGRTAGVGSGAPNGSTAPRERLRW
jgi:hypothetical protein